MKYQFFQIPVADAARMQAELNAFISQHRIAHSDKHFLADSANSFWLSSLAQNACRWVALSQHFQQPRTLPLTP